MYLFYIITKSTHLVITMSMYPLMDLFLEAHFTQFYDPVALYGIGGATERHNIPLGANTSISAHGITLPPKRR